MGSCSIEISDVTDKRVERIHADFMRALHDLVNETCAGNSYWCKLDDEHSTQRRAKQALKEGDDIPACLTHEPSMGGVLAGVKRPNTSPEGGNRRRQRWHQEKPAEAPDAATSVHRQEPLADHAAACSSGAAAHSSGVALAADQGDAHSAVAWSSGAAAHSSGVALASDPGDDHNSAGRSGAAVCSSGVVLASDQGDAHSAADCSSGAAARSSQQRSGPST